MTNMYFNMPPPLTYEEIDKKIAELLGWTKLVPRDNPKVAINVAGKRSLYTAWMGIDPQKKIGVVPPCSISANSTIALMPEHLSFIISWEFGEYYCELFHDGMRGDRWIGNQDTRAAALADAFLSYLEDPDPKGKTIVSKD